MFVIKESAVRTIKQNDPRFLIKDGLTVTPRAGFEISIQCPSEHRMILTEAINKGWIKPVAHITERELLFLGLTDSK